MPFLKGQIPHNRTEYVNKTCPVCGANFSVKPSHAKRRKFCSKPCMTRGQKGWVPWNKGKHTGHKPWNKGHKLPYQPKKPFPESFWSKVDIRDKDECWEWKGSRNKGRYGYGRFNIRGRAMLAHRVAYELKVGPVPKGLWVLHKCDNPPCCNSKHLYPGTPSRNVRDAIERGRMNHREWVLRGEKTPWAKLTEGQVVEIKLMLNAGATLRMAANKFKVAEHTIWCIKQGISWKEVSIPEGSKLLSLPPKNSRRTLNEAGVR